MQFVTLPDAALLTGQPQESIERLFKNSLHEKFIRVFGTNSYIHLEFLSLHFPSLAAPTFRPVVYQSLAADQGSITEDDQSILRQIVGESGLVQPPAHAMKSSQPLARLYDQLAILEKNAIPLIPEEKAMEIERIKQEIAALEGAAPTAIPQTAPHPPFPGATAAGYPLVRPMGSSAHPFASASLSASILFFLLSLLVFSILCMVKVGHQAQEWLSEHSLPLKWNSPRLSS